MKHATLRAIGHNLADSIASGCSLLLGVYEFDIFHEIAIADKEPVTMDFLNGVVCEGEASHPLRDIAARARHALPDMCASHGATLEDFAELKAKFFLSRTSRRFTIILTDVGGKRTEMDYHGSPARRMRNIDPLGRVRRDAPRVLSQPKGLQSG